MPLPVLSRQYPPSRALEHSHARQAVILVGVSDSLALLYVLLRGVSWMPSRDKVKLWATYDATSSLGFWVLTHCNENRLHVAHGVSPSQRIFLRRHRSQALETDFLLGCQSLTDVGEKRFGPSFGGRDAAMVSNKCCRYEGIHTKRAHGCRGAVRKSAPDGESSGIWRWTWTRSLQ